MTLIARYAKFAVAAIGVAATVLTALNVHAAWVPVVVAAATALGVGAVPNKPGPAAPPAAPSAR
jgi:hypothetical protein